MTWVTVGWSEKEDVREKRAIFAGDVTKDLWPPARLQTKTQKEMSAELKQEIADHCECVSDIIGHILGKTKAGEARVAVQKAQSDACSACREWLQATWPAVFADGVYKPLAIHVGDIVRSAAEACGFSAETLRHVMRKHCRSPQYQRVVAQDGSVRYDLAGEIFEPVSDAHRMSATTWLRVRKEAKKAQKKDKRDKSSSTSRED